MKLHIVPQSIIYNSKVLKHKRFFLNWTLQQMWPGWCKSLFIPFNMNILKCPLRNIVWLWDIAPNPDGDTIQYIVYVSKHLSKTLNWNNFSKKLNSEILFTLKVWIKDCGLLSLPGSAAIFLSTK